MNIAETIKTPRHHDANRPFGTAHMIKQPSKRTDVSGLQICKDPLPTHRASCGNKYAPIFEKLKHGEAVKCKPEDVNSVCNSLRKFIQMGGKTGSVKSMKDYGDGFGRVWLLQGK